MGEYVKQGSPRCLIYDIETAPIVGTVWGKYEQNLIWSIHDWYILCFSYRWLGERKKTVSVGLPDYKLGRKPGDWKDEAMRNPERYRQSLMPHTIQYINGDTDEDHLAAIRCNTAILAWYEANCE